MGEKIHEVSLEKEVMEFARTESTMIGISEPLLGKFRLRPPEHGFGVDFDRIYKLMEGAIDLHTHPGPSPRASRLNDEMELAMEACQAGMGAVVSKDHDFPTIRSCQMAQKIVNQWAKEHGKKGVDVFGGLVLGHACGGLNPAAVDAAARCGGKVIWTPSVDSSHHYRVMGITKAQGIDVLDEKDKVLPALKEIFSLIAESEMLLSICHQSTKERYILIDEARKAGVKRIELVHPMQPVTKMTVEQMKIAADKGAYIGLYTFDFAPKFWSWSTFMEAYRVVGPDKIAVSSDQGLWLGGSPVANIRQFIAWALFRGIPDRDVEKMVKNNARELLY